MPPSYVAPKAGAKLFNCPHCGALAQQNWFSVLVRSGKTHFPSTPEETTRLNAELAKLNANATQNIFATTVLPAAQDVLSWAMSQCIACEKTTWWRLTEIAYPGQLVGPPASADMPPEVSSLYEEARRVAGQSPRSAAALLRLAIDRLAVGLGAEGRDLFARVENLRSKGLPEQAISAMHALRKGGREAVHPGQIDLDDQPDLTLQLFKFVNLAVDTTITKPRELEDFHRAIPDKRKSGSAGQG